VNNTGESHIDVQRRLEQWKLEATDPQHPNYGHADLDHPLTMYTTISDLVDKLRETPENFTKQDVVALFGSLNSGGRMKNKVADENPLPQLQEYLLTLLYGDGAPGARIAAASRAIRFAAENMLGELYGWAHAEEVPLHNQCATNALAYLGYEFDPRHYEAFVAAHEQFNQVYQQHVGHLNPDLPLNLEIDKFYNVIDKVDLKARILGHPFDRLFADWNEAEWAFEILTEAAHTLGIEGPDDQRAAFNLRYRGGEHHLRLDYGTWLVLGFSGSEGVLREVNLALLDGQVTLEPTYQGRFAQRPEEQPVSLYGFAAEAVRPMPEDLRATFARTLDLVKARFAGRKKSLHWKANKPAVAQAVFDLGARELLLRQGMAPLTTRATEAEAEEPAAPTETHTSGVRKSLPDACPFTPQTFEMLAQLHEQPTYEFYTAQKDALKEHVMEPFKQLMMAVREELPRAIQDKMETERRIFAQILKQFAMQGCWTFYWGAFYPKGGKRTEDAQLFLWINRERVEFGFYIGEYGSDQRNRFLRNCRENLDVLARVLGENLPEQQPLFFGEREDLVGGIKGSGAVKDHPSFQEWLRDPADAGISVAVLLLREQVLQYTTSQLAVRIVEAYERLYPLVLLATLDNPMPAIGDYLDRVEPPPPNPPYPLSACAAQTGFGEALLARWIRAVERKGQAVLYGPPGTGKTYVAEHLARHLIGGGDGFYEIVQFHPAYAYEDFVQGIRPKAKVDGQLDYPVVPGRFLHFCEEAESREGRCVLIVDEINRANLARVFGELMYLLEYRDRKVPLAAGGSLRIPKNVRIIGTMNTADRSIALVDHALRRRFAFLALYPNYDLLQKYHQSTGFDVQPLISVLRKLNRQIGDRHYEVGITFFLREDVSEQLEDIWTMEIEPYLEEYFFDQQDKVDSFRWRQVSREILP
jgi:5-methylcytosine-specific restriction protein B